MDEFINSLSIYKKIIEKLSKFLLKNNLISMNKTYIKISYQCINYSYNHRKRFFYTTPPPPQQEGQLGWIRVGPDTIS